MRSRDPRRTPRTITPLSVPAIRDDGLKFPLSRRQLEELVRGALQEDGAFNDLTTVATVVSDRRARAMLVARGNGIVAGVTLATEAFRMLDPKVAMRVDVEDGTRVVKGDTIIFLTGHARALLSAERVALNFMQRLSGIATETRRYVDAVKGTGVTILDTRKTLPHWRHLEKYAVRAGGGANHRFDLSTGVLIKDNHLAAADGDIEMAIRQARRLAPAGTKIEIECESMEQVRRALDAGADIILLDNMSTDQLRECVQMVNKRAIIEASGGVTVDTVRSIAETGVDWISIGKLTHSAPALDLALDFELGG